MPLLPPPALSLQCKRQVSNMQQTEEKDYTQKFSLSLWKGIMHYAKDYYGHLLRLILCMAACAVCDVIFPLMSKYAIDTYISPENPDTGNLWLFCVGYGLLIAVEVFFIYRFLYLGGEIECGVCYTIRKQGFRKLQELPFSYYDTMPVGYLMSRMTSDAQRLAETIGWSLLDLVWGAVMIVLSLVTMFILQPVMTLIVLLVVPPLALISWQFQQKILHSYRKVRKTNSEITGSFNEGIMGAKTTKTLVREDRNMEEFTQLTHRMKRSSVRAASLSALYLPIVTSIGSIATAYVLWKGGSGVWSGVIGVGTLVAYVNYTMQLFEPIRNIAGTFADMQSAQAAAERVITLLQTEPDIVDSKEVEEVFGDNFHPKKENWPEIHGDIEFRHVDFQYKKGDKVLTDFNLTVKQGQTIALVGPTGAGKSTVVNLMCRFYEPTAGEVLIDGVDYRQRSQLWLQSHLGYVLQEPHLFSGTIAENIRYGKPDATDEEVHEAARMVNAEGFILKMENGYDTQVGEGGGRLSTGEKQLISFARAILADPAIFVLDEATSSVDTQTEMIIQNAISKVLTGRTSFIIAHRLSTVRTADRILLIRDGKIAESGTHRELIALKGEYYKLYTNQFAEERAMEILAEKDRETNLKKDV